MEYEAQHQLKLKQLDLKKEQLFHKILCPSCENEVKSNDLNINDKIAKCETCNVVFSFQETVNNLFINSSKTKQKIIKPEGIGQFNFKDELSFAIQQPYSGFDIAIGIFSIPLALLFTFMAVVKFKIFALVAAILLGIMSAFPIYNWITHAKKKIYINVKRDLLAVEWHPKKGNKDQRYNKNEIDQLYVRRDSGGMGHFEVYMILNGVDGQKHIRLIPGLNSLSKA